MKHKILLIASVFAFHGSFHHSLIKYLCDHDFDVTVASNNKNHSKFLSDYGQLDDLNINKQHIPFARSPFSLKTLHAYREIKHLLINSQFDIIHCHTPVASIITRLAAKNIKNRSFKIIYTAHGFHFYKGAPLKNWVMFYLPEKYCSKFTDVLITINTEDYAFSKKKLKALKNIYIPGVGINNKDYKSRNDSLNKQYRELFNIPKNATVLLSVGELNNNKNQRIILKALNLINNKNIFYICVGEGPNKEDLQVSANKLNFSENIKFIGYRNDVPMLYSCADIFIHPSYREGLPVSVMEAISCGLPCICSNIRGTCDLVINGKGGILYKPDDSDALANAITLISDDKTIQKKMKEFNIDRSKIFDSTIINKQILDVYDSLLS